VTEIAQKWIPKRIPKIFEARRSDENERILKMSSVARRGVKHAEVITVQLVQDERGWLRLAG